MIQSNQHVPIADLDIVAVVVTPPGASGVPQPVNLTEYLEEKIGGHGHGSLFKIRNSDKLCVVRAIACGVARARRHEGEQGRRQWAAVRKDKRPAQTRAAMDLVQRAGISAQGPHDISDVRKIQVNFEFSTNF